MAEYAIDNYDYLDDDINDVTETSESIGFSYDALAEQCLSGEYVLIVGPDVMLKKDLYDGCSESFIKHFLRNSSSSPRNICKTIAELEQKKKFDAVINNKHTEAYLHELLNTRCFNTIITTAYDPFLEKLLNHLWGGDSFDVCNIYGDGIEEKVDISYENISPNEFNEIRPILYYAFGKAEYKHYSSNGDIRRFAVSDDDKIRIVAKWMGSEGPVSFRQHISKKRVLAIGCRFDDWLFRFFWHMLRTDYTSNDSISQQRKANIVDETEEQRSLRGEVAFDYDPGNSLENYLKEKSVEVFKDDARDFMRKLVQALKEKKKNLANNMRMWKNNQLNHLDGNRGVFISYAHEDFWIVRRIYEQLTAKNYNVWMDVRLEAGDEYDKRIKDAIRQCKVFMPILSSTIVDRMNNGTYRERYFCKVEWNEAENRMNSERNAGGDNQMKVLPVLLDSVSLDNKVFSEKLPDFIRSKDIYEITKEKIQVLTVKLDEMLYSSKL
jgi:hypothetical protein